MSENHRLRDYQAKRDFRRTGEPSGGGRKPGDKPVFVIQKHDARAMHYDFRLEAEGVLKSWAVPKGPSTDPRQKRLAVATEDHPLEYADFEGVIPDGEYGAGPVLVWDTGPYHNLRARKGRHSQGMDDALGDGLIEVWLEGEKLKGGYALKRIEDGRKPRWLIIKMVDEHADARRHPTRTQPASVETGRNLDEVAEDGTEGRE